MSKCDSCKLFKFSWKVQNKLLVRRSFLSDNFLKFLLFFCTTCHMLLPDTSCASSGAVCHLVHKLYIESISGPLVRVPGLLCSLRSEWCWQVDHPRQLLILSSQPRFTTSPGQSSLQPSLGLPRPQMRSVNLSPCYLSGRKLKIV